MQVEYAYSLRCGNANLEPTDDSKVVFSIENVVCTAFKSLYFIMRYVEFMSPSYPA